MDAQQAFPDVDLAVMKELYLQANKSKQLFFEMLFQLANPEAGESPEL